MNRRHFLTSTIATGMVATAPLRASASEQSDQHPQAKFTLSYAPHFGMFNDLAGDDLIDQLRFAADHGFTAWEDNGMNGRTVAVQQRIASEMSKLGMQMGVISALRGVWGAVNFAGDNADARERVVQAMRKIVDVAKRVNAKWLTVVPGLLHPKLPRDVQTANCVELLRRCADVVEPHGLVMVLEPLNRRVNHPGVLLAESARAWLLCRAVNRPSCKILFDIYHQQITEGHLLAHLDLYWDEIAYLQSGDNPGRNEPGTGEINYQHVFAHIAAKGYEGIIGMEHGVSGQGRAGEEKLIEAYRRVDPPRQAAQG